MLGACGSNHEAPHGDADDSSPGPTSDDSGAPDDSGANGTDDSGAGTDDSAPVVDTAAAVERGAAIVDAVCNHCHGPGNQLANRIAGLDDHEIASVIENGSGYMPAQDLDPDEIADVLAYLRATFSDEWEEYSPWSASTTREYVRLAESPLEIVREAAVAKVIDLAAAGRALRTLSRTPVRRSSWRSWTRSRTPGKRDGREPTWT